MPRVACLCFRRAGKSYDFDAGDLELEPGDVVVARTTRGQELGLVREVAGETAARPARGELKPVLRKATEEDLRNDADNREREREAMEVAARKIVEHGLEMKLIEAEATLDGSRIVLHFSADGRVDFRALVRDLARAVRMRVELHQVGVRDEAKMRGGLGHCGRQLCCATFLTDFDPVGIRMAKEQELSLNPQKISGMCGRLMCCLSFEYEFYRDARQCVPKTGSKVETQEGAGRLTEVDVVRNRAVVTLEEGGKIQLPLQAVMKHKPGCRHGAGPCCRAVETLAGEPDSRADDAPAVGTSAAQPEKVQAPASSQVSGSSETGEKAAGDKPKSQEARKTRRRGRRRRGRSRPQQEKG
jgi:cell fate regulator YaaT (PSP1 superfamily)